MMLEMLGDDAGDAGRVIEPEGSWLLCLVWEEGRWSTDDLRLIIGLLLVNSYLFSNYRGLGPGKHL